MSTPCYPMDPCCHASCSLCCADGLSQAVRRPRPLLSTAHPTSAQANPLLLCCHAPMLQVSHPAPMLPIAMQVVRRPRTRLSTTLPTRLRSSCLTPRPRQAKVGQYSQQRQYKLRQYYLGALQVGHYLKFCLSWFLGFAPLGQRMQEQQEGCRAVGEAAQQQGAV
jgi:hypothetical protein